jgi:ParB family chromosome partitioning protein
MPPKKVRTGFDASYLSGLSENADQSNVLGSEVTKKHEELQQEIQAAVADPSRLQYIDITLLDPNPWQGRQSMDEEQLNSLMEEIKENGFNEAMPVVARLNPKLPGRFQIVFGHRRTLSSQRAGLTQVPVLVKDYTDEDMLFLQAKENLLREQFTPIDEAYMFHNMITVLGYTQEAVAAKIRQSRGYIRNRLELVKSPEDVQAMVRQDPETVRAAYYLNKVENAELRVELIQAILEKKITGESIPGYLLTLREAQNQERQVQTPLSAVNESSLEDEQHLASPLSNGKVTVSESHITSPVATKQLASLPSGPIQNSTGDVAVQQPPTSVEQVMEAGEKRSKELLEAGKLRTVLSQLQGYQNRCKKRQTPPSSEELSLLNAIENLSHALQEGKTSVLPPTTRPIT